VNKKTMLLLQLGTWDWLSNHSPLEKRKGAILSQ
jgi:hypothetical protein